MDSGSRNPRYRVFAWLVTIIVAWLAVVSLPARCMAQADDDPGIPNVFVRPDRTTLRWLLGAQQLVEEGKYGEAVRLLDAIVEAPEDYLFQPDRDKQIHRSLKAEARRLIGEMPRKGRELYELQCGTRAKQLLAEAAGAGDPARLAEVSRRFFHTHAGYEATMLLGLHHLDHGRPLAAALTLGRLRESLPEADSLEPTLSLAMAVAWVRAGMTDEARQTLLLLRSRMGNKPLRIGGKEIAWFESADPADLDQGPVEWLEGAIGPQPVFAPAAASQWALFRGDVARNAASAGGPPLLSMRWRVPTSDNPLVEVILRKHRRIRQEHRIPTLPGIHPLAVGDIVLMRTTKNLLAVELPTGKRLWEVPVDDPLEALLAADTSQQRNSMQLINTLRLRMWQDRTYGSLSSDGRLVFAIEDLAQTTSKTSTRTIIINNQRMTGQSVSRPYNRLTAHDIRSGKLQWEVGGSDGQFGLPLADTFFLGPPLPLMGQLYVLAKIEAEIRLLVLDAETGKLAWEQQLAELDPAEFRYNSGHWRTAGVSPSYADGILVCPTPVGAVVAIDLTTRSLVWGYQYPRGSAVARPGIPIRRPTGTSSSRTTDQWVDNSVTVSGGRVLLTPVDASVLYCLNLLDGKELWTAPRGANLYVACVHRDRVVLVGKGELSALGLADGKPAWKDGPVKLPGEAMPSGRGFLADDQYYVPLTTSELATIDVVSGRCENVSKTHQSGSPGNLICHKGWVISQEVDRLDAYYQLDFVRQQVRQRLAEHPDDPPALALQGEVLLDEGRHSEAIASLRKSVGLEPDPRTRKLLLHALMDGLGKDFATHSDRGDEIRALVDDPRDEAAFLRRMAVGWHEAGRWGEAFSYYNQLIALDSDRQQLEQLSTAHAVRRDRWVGGRLAALREAAPAEQKTAIDRAITAELATADEANSPEALRRFLQYYGNLPVAGDARRRLAGRLADGGEFLEAELLLRRELKCGDPRRAGAAVAQLIGLLDSNQRSSEAADYLPLLAGELAEVDCGGQTGSQWAEGLGGKIEGDHAWPTGPVVVKYDKPEKQRITRRSRTALPNRGSRGTVFADTRFEADQSQRTIIASDPLGNPLWQVSFATPDRYPMGFSRNSTQVRTNGHQAVFSLGHRIVAVDTVGTDAAGSPRLLWNQNLLEDAAHTLDQHRIAIGPNNLPWGLQQMQLAQYHGRVMGQLGPVTDGYIAIQRFADLTAVDPVTGSVLWVRRGLPEGSRLFGDDRHVFVVPTGKMLADKDKLIVIDAADGEIIDRRDFYFAQGGDSELAQSTPFQFEAYCKATFGSRILLQRSEGSHLLVELYDVGEQRHVWPPRKFAAGAKICLAEDRALGVLEPDGRLVLVSLPDGQTMVDAKLEKEKIEDVSELIVMPSGDQFVVIVHYARREGVATLPTQPMPGVSHKQINFGRVYMFDSQGKSVWPEPVEIERQHLLLNQPARIPILTFACQAYERDKVTNRGRYQVAIRCLDKRSGEQLFAQKYATSTSVFELRGYPEKNLVEIQLQSQTINIEFTDAPREGSEKTVSGDSAGSLRALKNALGRGAVKAVRGTADPLEVRIPVTAMEPKQPAEEKEEKIADPPAGGQTAKEPEREAR